MSWELFGDEDPESQNNNLWAALMSAEDMRFVVQTAASITTQCILMTQDPEELVFQPACGTCTTAEVAGDWYRRWIARDTSRVAVAIARQRLMTANYDYCEMGPSR